ncbi:hypothetical protein Droror1_Dr00010088 [Drosera rotundifolia]
MKGGSLLDIKMAFFSSCVMCYPKTLLLESVLAVCFELLYILLVSSRVTPVDRIGAMDFRQLIRVKAHLEQTIAMNTFLMLRIHLARILFQVLESRFAGEQEKENTSPWLSIPLIPITSIAAQPPTTTNPKNPQSAPSTSTITIIEATVVIGAARITIRNPRTTNEDVVLDKIKADYDMEEGEIVEEDVWIGERMVGSCWSSSEIVLLERKVEFGGDNTGGKAEGGVPSRRNGD